MNLHKIILELMTLPQIEAIRLSIRKDYFKGFGWTSGGCFAFAEAISASLPTSELWIVGVQTKGETDWTPNHAIVKFDGNFYDAKGQQSEKKLIKDFGWTNKGYKAKLGNVHEWLELEEPDCCWYPEQEFVREEEIHLIAKEFCKLAGLKAPRKIEPITTL